MNDRKPQFFTSDWHIGHDKSIIYDKRPFANMDEMCRKLINNFNSSVSNEAITYFAGDMGWANDRLKHVMAELNGTKVLILGNHDENPNKMYRFGFDVVVYGVTLYIAKQRVTITHCPLRGVVRENIFEMRGAKEGECWHGESRHMMFSTEDEGQFHLHGHIHSPNGGKSQKTQGRQFDVGVVANNYRPVSISQIESWITKYGR